MPACFMIMEQIDANRIIRTGGNPQTGNFYYKIHIYTRSNTCKSNIKPVSIASYRDIFSAWSEVGDLSGYCNNRLYTGKIMRDKVKYNWVSLLADFF